MGVDVNLSGRGGGGSSGNPGPVDGAFGFSGDGNTGGGPPGQKVTTWGKELPSGGELQVGGVTK